MKKTIGFVINHGHMDIEWYLPLRGYRFWTIEALDGLIDICRERADYGVYVLDGTVILLDIYLGARPERRGDIQKLIDGGKLAIGPFYTQFDEWLPSPEAIVRNCLYGDRECKKWGKPMKAGYLPDNFGHPRQLPQILNNFGIDSLLFMRGMPEIAGGHPDEFIYEGLDGSRLLTSHFRDGYSAGMYGVASAPPQPRGLPYYGEYISYEWHQELARHDDCERIAKRIIAGVDLMKERYPSGVVPIIAGFDHAPPQALLGEMVRAANAMRGDIKFVMGTAEDYIRAVRERVLGKSVVREGDANECAVREGVAREGAANEGAAGERVARKGVVRESAAGERAADPMVYREELIGSRYQYVLLGALSTRGYLKRRHFAAEALLERYAEPLDALASLTGFGGTDAMLDESWKSVMINSTHDSIHGSSLDDVHVEMESRYAGAQQTAAGIAHNALKHVGRLVNPWWEACEAGSGAAGLGGVIKAESAANGSAASGESGVAEDAGNGVAEATGSNAVKSEAIGILVYTPNACKSAQVSSVWLPVGEWDGVTVRDEAGNTFPAQVLPPQQIEINGIGRPRLAPWPEEPMREVLSCVPGEPFGVSSYAAVREYKSERTCVKDEAYAAVYCGGNGCNATGVGGSVRTGGSGAEAGKGGGRTLRAGDSFIENAFIRVEADGALLNLLDKRTGVWRYGLNLLAEEADAGDAWDYSPPWIPGETVLSTRFPFVSRLIENGPVRATLEMTGTMDVPARLVGDARSGERVAMPVTFNVSVLCSSPRVDVRLDFDNYARDHRLRLRVPAGVRTRTIKSQSHFAILERSIEPIKEIEPWLQPPSRLMPFREWLAADDGVNGLAVAVKGLYDYEAVNDPLTNEPDIYLTLLRGFEYMSRVNMPQRIGAAASCHHTPGSQCPGRQTVEWSYIPYACRAGDAAPFLAEAHSFLYPPAAHAVRNVYPASSAHEAHGALNALSALVCAAPFGWRADNIVFSAFKRAIDKDGYILRFYEHQGKRTTVDINIGRFKKASSSDMNESHGEELPVVNGAVRLDIAPYKIITLRLI